VQNPAVTRVTSGEETQTPQQQRSGGAASNRVQHRALVQVLLFRLSAQKALS